MTLMIEVSPQTQRRLEEKARERGQSVSEFVRGVVEVAANGNDTNGAVRRVASGPRRPVLGKYAGVGSSVDEFLREKHEENEREEAKYRRRRESAA